MVKIRLAATRVNKQILLRNVVIFWLGFYMSILIAFIVNSFLFYPEYVTISVLLPATICFIFIYVMFLLIHHIAAQYNLRKGILFSSARGDGWIVRYLHPTGVRRGTLIGVRLNCYLRKVRRQEWSNKIFNYVITQQCTVERPLILRSHLLSLPEIRSRLISRLEEQGLHCSVSHGLPMNAKFRLLWLTTSIIAAFQLYLPAICDRETEIIITPATGFVE